MLAFPGMLVPFAESVGMKVPKDPDKFDPHKFPHFAVYREIQIGRAIVRNCSHAENARIIAEVPDDKIKTITFGELIEMGVE